MEFFAQIHQLIHGGRDPSLRAPATLDALAALAAARRIDGADAAALCAAYVALRTVEHRLQMVNDLQTHMLPREPAALDNVARLHGLADGAALVGALCPHVARVGGVYDALVGAEEPRLPAEPRALERELEGTGLADPAAAQRLIDGWRGRPSAAAHRRGARGAGGGAARADRRLRRGARRRAGDDPLRRDARGAAERDQLLRLLEAQPALMRLLSAILCHAPTLADQLGRRAQLLDGLIDASALAPMPGVEALVAELREREQGGDYQWLLDHVRRIVGEKKFALGTQIVAGDERSARGFRRLCARRRGGDRSARRRHDRGIRARPRQGAGQRAGDPRARAAGGRGRSPMPRTSTSSISSPATIWRNRRAGGRSAR